ncbi:uncharacterized protein LOC141529297 [Cotesia typhae]|uniref:uncharacterized protein LOC141529297 n=1 Tax=Cotesia typhae TaxID=2053667 RepID=UPI003D68EE0D
MPTKHCAFANCTSDSRYKQDGVKFIPFIKPQVDRKKCLEWIHLSRRADLTIDGIKKHTYVCTKHFINSNGPTIENPNPLPATVSKIPKDRKRQQRCNEEDSRTEDCKHRKLICSTHAATDELLAGEISNKHTNSNDRLQLNYNFTSELENNYNFTAPNNTELDVAPHLQIVSTCDAESQTEEDTDVKKLKTVIECLEKKLESTAFDVDSCRNNVKKFKYYTGLKPEDFDTLWEFLGPPATESLRKWLTTESKTDRESQRTQNKFKKLDIFPSAETIKKNYLPKVFRKFKNIRVIIDCFEWNMQKSKNFNQQGNTYSSYKSHNTVKFLVGIIPTGGCCFLSDGFEGRISDKEITIKSGFFNNIKQGDLIMADRGFNIEELCNKYKCSLVIPPFLKKRKCFSKEEIRTAREIAAARIHVERFIGRMKEFRIMQRVISKNMLPIISQITFVIAMLVNFQEPLVM